MKVVIEVSNTRELASRAGITLSALGKKLHCHYSLASAKLSGSRVWYGPEVEIFMRLLVERGVHITMEQLRELVGYDQIYEDGRWVRPSRLEKLKEEASNARS